MNWLYEPWKLAINQSHELAPLIQAFTRTQVRVSNLLRFSIMLTRPSDECNGQECKEQRL
jgi:hypothetical protein